MQIKKNQVILGVCFLLTISFNCVHQSLGTVPDQINVIIQDSSLSKSVFIRHGYCTKIGNDSIKYYSIKLDHLQGGRQRLFGLLTISEHEPNDLKRIIIIDSTRHVAEYSVNEILKMDTINMEERIVYIIK